MKILVLGAGMMGRAIAYDLNKFSNFEHITIVDRNKQAIKSAEKFLEIIEEIDKPIIISKPEKKTLKPTELTKQIEDKRKIDLEEEKRRRVEKTRRIIKEREVNRFKDHAKKIPKKEEKRVRQQRTPESVNEIAKIEPKKPEPPRMF